LKDATKWNLLDETTAIAVPRLKRKADNVMHERPIDQNGALNVLIEVRGFLQEIYSASGGF